MLAADSNLIECLRRASAICGLTGAGISAESGIPTFRGSGGLWQGHRAEDLATPHAFASDPQLVWEFYNDRRRNLLDCHPNPGHYALAELERRTPQWTLVTQNVDGLHARAGSSNILELHGNIWTVHCTECAQQFDRTDEMLPDDPRCPLCPGRLRPGVVWFGESLPEATLASAIEAAQSCDVLVVAGTSGVVQPAAGLADVACQHGATVIEINPEDTPLTALATHCVRGPAGRVLPAILEALGPVD
jgi:NAD-dependent deacetylase